MTDARLPHLPALDGVRALAVLAVMLYHANVGLSAGFLGVDVFFVLSGFLITSLLLVEATRTGTVSLGHFWVRRAKRLLPALLVVLLAVSAYAQWGAAPVVRERLRGDLLATLAYAANWHFIRGDTDYFEQYAAPTPLLHTWSLAIEEQFYLVWPLLALGVATWLARARRARSAAGRHGRVGQPLALVALVITLAAAVSVVLTAVLWDGGLGASRVYYGTDTRAQALLVGALLAVVAHHRGWWQRARGDGGTSGHVGGRRVAIPSPGRAPEGAGGLVTTLAGGVGLLALATISATASGSDDWLYLGGLFAVAAAAAALVAAAAHPAPNPVQRLLAQRPLVATGAISYGLYLWHWPVFVVLDPARLGGTGDPVTGLPLLLARFAATFALAGVSYVALERPVRRWQPTGQGPRCLLPAMTTTAISALVCAGVAVAATGSAAAWATPGHASASSTATGPAGSGTTDPGPATQPSIFLLGDSAAWNLHGQFAAEGRALGIRVSGSTQLGCDVLGGEPIVNGSPVRLSDECPGWERTWRQGVQTASPDLAVIMLGNGLLFDHDFGDERVTFGSAAYRSRILAWLDATVPDLEASSDRVAITTIACFRKPDTGLDDTAASVNDPRRQEWVNGVLREFVAAHPDVELLDLRSLLCPGGEFHERVAGARVHTEDGVHYSREGAAVVWDWLASENARLAAARS